MKNTKLSHKKVLISVIIPTLNGADSLKELLAALSIQTLQPHEVLVIDSSSADKSAEIAREYNAQTLIIERKDFDHGGTRTLGVQKATGEIIVFFTQDVIPAHRSVLENLTAPFLENDNIAVSFGRQLPSFYASEIARHLRLFNYPEHSYVRDYSDRMECGLKTIFASNSCAAYRKSHLSEIGYFQNKLIFGEDTCAVGRLLEKGYQVAYIAEAPVYHSHNNTRAEDFKRYFDIGVLHCEEEWLLKTYGTAEGRGLSYVQSGISYLIKRRRYGLIVDFMVRTVLKYVGYRLGRQYKRLPRTIIPQLSMHRDWWETGQ